jgi:hypothetical protein
MYSLCIVYSRSNPLDIDVCKIYPPGDFDVHIRRDNLDASSRVVSVSATAISSKAPNTAAAGHLQIAQ